MSIDSAQVEDTADNDKDGDAEESKKGRKPMKKAVL